MPKSYSFNADSMAISYRTKDNDVKMMSAETANGGVRSNGGSRDYARVRVVFLLSLTVKFCHDVIIVINGQKTTS